MSLDAPPAQARPLALTFTGNGAEYFRIWIVNLLLTIITFGIYSAWAKVRRLQYFDRNTTLDGAAFDFHGKPMAILKGRILALLLVTGYQYAFGFSISAGLVVVGALLLVLPMLLRGALRFRLHNTSWRGLRFGFTGTTQEAYATFIPPMLVFMLPGVAGAMAAGGPAHAPSPWLALFGLLYLAWPVMHAAVKRYQHAHIRFGGVDSIYTLKTRRFWPPYLIAFGIMIALGIVAAVALPVLAKLGSRGAIAPFVLIGLAVLAYAALLSLFPYMQARIGNLVWSHTSFPGVAIASDMTFGGLFKLHAVNTILTILTIGLFRPFAAVRTQRYILAHLHITSSVDIDALESAGKGADVNAAGDGAADFLGIDFAL
ncbi:YjgN family protein [Massilia sp. S19_KUP03_FR1]|uniref:YjgN family protein n=1 Tax=Massilia sp. S19_KUP03_FR1 TaxID=3025503 RepID=UPI002FCD5FD1